MSPNSFIDNSPRGFYSSDYAQFAIGGCERLLCFGVRITSPASDSAGLCFSLSVAHKVGSCKILAMKL